jgi:Tol biopolymer transport system component
MKHSRVIRWVAVLAMGTALTTCVVNAYPFTQFAAGCEDAEYRWPLETPDTEGDLAGVWVLDGQGAEPRSVAAAKGVTSIAWSPDGEQLAWMQEGGGAAGRVMVSNADGSAQRLLAEVHSPAYVSYSSGEEVAWTPDGSAVRYAVQRDENRRQVWDHYAVGLEGSDPVLIAPELEAFRVAFSPDGTRIAYIGVDGQLHTINSDGSGRRRLTDGPRGMLDPAWSPDGTQIVFVAHRKSSSGLEVVNPDGTGRRVVTEKGGRFFGQPVWSPDEKWIAFNSAPHEDWGWVTVVRPDGSDRHDVTPQLGRPNFGPIGWSPDSTRLAYAEGDGITVGGVDGSGRRCVSEDGFNSLPTWSPDGARLAFIRQ